MSALAATLANRLPVRAVGVLLAFATALVSGVSVYLNGRAVKHFDDATVYTTAKNAVAGILLLALALAAFAPPTRAGAPLRTKPATTRDWLAVVAVAVVGGSVAFVLFFEGLARAEATQAAFIHKTLVLWVAILAVPLLRERVGPPHLLAIALLLAGQAWIVGDAGTVVFGTGEVMILAATLLWAIEVVVVKHLLSSLAPRTLAAARMGLGTVLLVGWLAISGDLAALAQLSGDQLSWVVLTGLLLTAYVGTWYAALARAQAVDVTAVLVFGAVVTAVIAGIADGARVDVVGTTLVAAGAVLAAALALRAPREAATT